MAHRGIWLAATACLVAGVLAAPPGSGLADGRAQVAADTSYQPSGPLTVRPDPLPPPRPTEPAPATELPGHPPIVPDLVAPAPRRTTERPVTTVSVSKPAVSKPQPVKPKPKPTKPKPPKPTKPKPTKPKPAIPLPQPGPPDPTGTTWQGKLISKTTPNGKAALNTTKPPARTRG